MESQELYRFTVEIDKNLHTNLKILSAGHQKSMRDIVQDAIKKEVELLQRKLYEK